MGDFALGNSRRAQQGQALLGLQKAAANPPWLLPSMVCWWMSMGLLLSRAVAQTKVSSAGACARGQS